MSNLAEVEEIIIEDVGALVEFDINVARINEIREVSKNLVISDNKSYEATKSIRTEVVKMRTTLDKARKAKVDPLNAEVKRINSKAAELVAQDAADAEVRRALDEAAEQLRKEREEALLSDKEKLILWLQAVIDIAPVVYASEGETVKREMLGRLRMMLQYCEDL